MKIPIQICFLLLILSSCSNNTVVFRLSPVRFIKIILFVNQIVCKKIKYAYNERGQKSEKRCIHFRNLEQ